MQVASGRLPHLPSVAASHTRLRRARAASARTRANTRTGANHHSHNRIQRTSGPFTRCPSRGCFCCSAAREKGRVSVGQRCAAFADWHAACQLASSRLSHGNGPLQQRRGRKARLSTDAATALCSAVFFSRCCHCVLVFVFSCWRCCIIFIERRGCSISLVEQNCDCIGTRVASSLAFIARSLCCCLTASCCASHCRRLLLTCRSDGDESLSRSCSRLRSCPPHPSASVGGGIGSRVAAGGLLQHGAQMESGCRRGSVLRSHATQSTWRKQILESATQSAHSTTRLRCCRFDSCSCSCRLIIRINSSHTTTCGRIPSILHSRNARRCHLHALRFPLGSCSLLACFLQRCASSGPASSRRFLCARFY